LMPRLVAVSVFPSLLSVPSTMTYEPTLIDDLLIVPALSCPASYCVALVRTTVVTPVYSVAPDGSVPAAMVRVSPLMAVTVPSAWGVSWALPWASPARPP